MTPFSQRLLAVFMKRRVLEFIEKAACDGVNFTFGERFDGGQVSAGQTAMIGSRKNTNSQELVLSLNGSSESTILADWMREAGSVHASIPPPTDKLADSWMYRASIPSSCRM